MNVSGHSGRGILRGTYSLLVFFCFGIILPVLSTHFSEAQQWKETYQVTHTRFYALQPVSLLPFLSLPPSRPAALLPTPIKPPLGTLPPSPFGMLPLPTTRDVWHIALLTPWPLPPTTATATTPQEPPPACSCSHTHPGSFLAKCF